ncbi:MAG: leucine-rich repeat protein, partial [Bacteroidaceae bacterium]|nr:leucine-rich repeat protein [Bacteroidaceae bacterium]
RAFEYSGLKSIEIPDNVTSLGAYAFFNCKDLESAKLSKRLTYDNDFSYFQGCTKMTRLRLYAGVPPTIGYEPYLSFRTNCVLEVPRGTEDLYRNAAYWKDFKEINGFLTGDKLNAQDFAALQEMYNSLGGENWTHKWDLSNDDCYTGRWYGVSTEDNQIVSINLSGNGLSGRIPSSVFELPMLTTLDLSNGEIDMLVDDILEYTPNRVNIQKLYLQNNKLKGDVYAFISKLPTLQEVDLTCNQLTEVSKPLNSTVLKTLKLNNQFVRNGEFVYNPEVLPAEIVDLGLPCTMSLNTLQRYNHDSNKYLDASGMVTLYKLTITENGNISWSWLSHKLKDTDEEGVYEILPYDAYGYMLRPVNNTIHFMSARDSGGKYYPKPLLIRYIEGDINVDRYVDVTDLSTLLLFFQLGERWSSGVFNYSAAQR